MKKILIFLLPIVSFNALAQQQELVDNDSKDAYAGRSYIYTGSVTLTPGSVNPTEGFRVSAAEHGTFFIRPAEAIKIPQNIPPSPNENFVRVENILVNGVTAEDQIPGLSISQRAMGYQYSDGAGRSTQSVNVKGSPGGYDIVQPLAYDSYGRTPIAYLPFVSSEVNGAIKSSPLTNQDSFYNGTYGVAADDRPYQEYEFELSPLNRVKKVYGAGQLWKNITTNKGAEGMVQVNLANVVRRWYINSSTGLPESNTYYNGGALLCSTSISEEGYATKSYSDFMGNVVMTDNNGLQTYYAFDLLGQLRYILPPELSKLYPPPISLAQPDQATLNTWAFQYKYDIRQRLSQEKGPGPDNDWVYFVYDHWDRLVAKQDGAQRFKSPKEWSFIKYDELNRPVMTGIFKTTINGHQGMIDAVSGVRYEIEDASSFGYTTGNTFPSTSQSGISSVEVLTITYYDDYSFRNITGWSDNNSYYYPDSGLPVLEPVLGAVTGSKIKILGQSTWLTSATYYDNQYRPIQSVTRTHLSGVPDRVTNTYNFAGWVTQNQRKHYNPSTSVTVTITETYEYDHAGRLKKNFHQIDSNPQVLVGAYNYNELGQLIETNLHSADNGSTFLQSIDYRYNIRGWLTSVNNSQLSNDGGVTNNDTGDLFGMNLSYNQETININGTNTYPLYDGRITAARWSSINLRDPIKERVYGYSYDAQQRFAEARFAAKNGSLWTDEPGMYDLSASLYDDNGNIKRLKRYSKVSGTQTLIDDLTYGYESNGNQLTNVDDATNNHFGYPDKTAGITVEMGYDKNGNLASDLNSEITSVIYNVLNLPEKIVIDLPNTSNDNSIEYQYDATGYVVKKIYKKGITVVRTVDYAHGIQYYDGQLSLVFTSEGRASAYNGSFEYGYFLKDHLSNTRVVFGYLHGTDVFRATMEPENATVEESSVTGFRNVAERRTYSGTVNKTPPTQSLPIPDHTALVKAHAIYTANTMGPAKMIQVSQGDRLSMQAYAITVSGTGGDPSIVDGVAAIVANSFGIVNSGETQSIYNAFQNVVPGYSGSIISGSSVPKAYLCYILFDFDYTVSQFGYYALDNTGFTQWQFLSVDVTAPYNGYMYIYTANESTVSEAYFDEVKIVHHKNSYSLRVTEVNDYDPYGLVLEGTQYVDEGRIANNYKYQGEFAEYENWTGWTRFEGRGNYDRRLGRWHSTDPANQFVGITQYAGMGNNPVLYPDPDGRVLPLVIAGAALIGGVGNVWSNWDDISGVGQFNEYFFVGAAAGGISLVNPLAGATILSGGNMAVDLMHGRPVDFTEAVTDFGYTYVGGKAGKKALDASSQLAEELMALNNVLKQQAGQRGVDFKQGVKVLKSNGKIHTATTQLPDESIIKVIELQEFVGVSANRLKSFRSHQALVRGLGAAGPGKAWHHIVTQSKENVAKFGPESIHNTDNVIALPHGAGSIHQRITDHYNTIQPFTNGVRVREWLNSQNFESQYQYGVDLLLKFGWTF